MIPRQCSSAGAWSELLGARFSGLREALAAHAGPREDWRAAARLGGFPVPAHELASDEARSLWFSGYVQTYLERDLPHEKKASVEVWPVAVEQVARKDDEVHLLIHCEPDEVLERPARRVANLLDRRALVAVEATQGAVEMDVGGVEEFHQLLGQIWVILQFDLLRGAQTDTEAGILTDQGIPRHQTKV